MADFFFEILSDLWADENSPKVSTEFEPKFALPHMAAASWTVQGGTRLSRSLVWELERRYYRDRVDFK